MLLRLLAHEDRRDRLSLDEAQLRDRARDRHRAHFKAADIIDVVVGKRIESQLGEQRRAFRIEHGRLEIEIEVALAARRERDLAAPERALEDDVGEPRAAVSGCGFREMRTCELLMFRRQFRALIARL